MISAISWIPKGAAKSVPISADPPSKEEIEQILNSVVLAKGEASGDEDDDGDMAVDASMKEDEVAHALAAADSLRNSSKDIDAESESIADALKELDMDNYDEEDDGIELFGSGDKNLFYSSNDLDPYLKDKNDYDSEEEEDLAIKPEDTVIVCARNEDEVSSLEVWILENTEDGDKNMYTHHDIILPAFPLCTAWLDCPLKDGDKGNFIAVGSMEPAIEIWDLDIMDEVQPTTILGGVVEKKRKGKKKSVKYKEGSHTDAVLGLAWNKEYRNILASASADKLVKIWDVSTGKCNITMDHHSDKVQSIAWNPCEPQVLLSGSFDHSVCLRDGRKPSHSGLKWPVVADVESLAWDPHNQHSFVVSLENGTVVCFDVRNGSSDASSESKPSFTLHAHDKAVCSVSYNPAVPNVLATGSMDKTVKLWDISDNQPSNVAARNPKAGAIFSVSFSAESPSLLAIGGSKGKLQLWDVSSEAAIARKFDKHSNQRKPPSES